MYNIKKVEQELQKVNEAIFDILNYYTCPPKCHAFCCKQFAVDLTDIEYNRLRKLSRENTDKSKIVKYDRTCFHQLDTPCPFLGHDESCTAYNIRPLRCHTYPFNLTVIPSSPVMQIYPCMMGTEINKDFFKYKIFEMERTGDIEMYQVKLEISSILGKLDERSKKLYSNPDVDVETIGLTFNEIFGFLDYLNEVKTMPK